MFSPTGEIESFRPVTIGDSDRLEELTGVTVMSNEEVNETDEVTTANESDDLDSRLDDINPDIHDGQQGKHVPGHNNYIDGRSQLNPGENPQELLDEVLNGDHDVVGEGARGNPVVDFGRPIGVDATTGESTQYGTIHSGNKGTHIVPANPNKYNQ